MSEPIESSTLRKNPELLRITLLKTIEDLTACISDEAHFTEKTKDDILRNQIKLIQPIFKKRLENSITDMWNELDISSNASYVHQLESSFPPDFTAWRPTPGEIPHLNVRGQNLSATIKNLQMKIETREEELKKIRTILYLKASSLRESVKKLSKNEESITKLYSDYDKTVVNENT